MRTDRFTWLALPWLLVALAIAQTPASLELSAEEKKDLMLLNQAITIQQQLWQLAWAPCGKDGPEVQKQTAAASEQFSKLSIQRADLLAKLEKARGEGVKCDAATLKCSAK